MDYKFQVQDPTSPDTVYLFEAIIDAVSEAETWSAVYAFASRDAVDELLLEPAIKSFLAEGNVNLIVGIDAVTDRATLERLVEVESDYSGFKVRVFWNRAGGLFHPKVSHFRYRDGRQTVIVGSGNLTPGGLRENFEAYSILQLDPGERLDFSPWDDFIKQHHGDIRPIDAEALERAARNRARGLRRRPRIEADVAVVEEPVPLRASPRILVAQIPRAGGRWRQAHFNEDVIRRFFRIKPASTQKVFLRERRIDGSLGPPEVRPLVLSRINRNPRIELAARGGIDYPAGSDPPVAVFRELHVRTFHYMLLMPGDEGYAEMLAFTLRRPSIGRGVRRVISDVGTMRAVWPGCPLY